MGEVVAYARGETPRETLAEQSVLAEQQIIGALMFDSSAYNYVGKLETHHFYEPYYGFLYRILVEQIKAGKPCDPIAIMDKISEQKAYGQLGGLTHLANMVEKCPPVMCLAGPASIVINNWSIRTINAFVTAHSKATDAQELISDLEAHLREVSAVAAPASDFQNANAVFCDYLERAREVATSGEALGLFTGHNFVRDRLGGLMAGELIIVGGRPGMGKSLLMRNLAFGAAVHNPDYVFPIYSLEMRKYQIIRRSVSALSYLKGHSLSYSKLRNPTLEHIEKIEGLRDQFPSNILIKDDKRLWVDDIRRDLFQLKRKGKKIGAVHIDYFQIMERPRSNTRNEASVLGDMTRELKNLAGEFDTCIVLLCQLSRRIEERDSKRPMLSDLRESGSLEQDADIVLFPYREAYYLEEALRNNPPRSPEKVEALQGKLNGVKWEMDIIGAKVREGAKFTETIYCGVHHDLIANSKTEAQAIWESARGIA